MLGLLLGFVLTAITALFSLSTRTQSLYKGWEPLEQNATLPLASLDALQIIVTIFSIILKYIPGTPGNKTRLKVNSDGTGFDLQPVSLQGPIKVEEKDIDKFNTALDATRDSNLNPFFFVSFTTPLLLCILANHSCPICPLGSVNTRNQFEFKDVTFCRDKQDILSASTAGELSYFCRFGGKQMPGRRRNHSPRFNDQVKSDSNSSALTQEEKETTKVKLHIKSSGPRRWAASCGDYNPIHISTLAAKLFGFRSVIAHGNHAVALAIQGTLDGIKTVSQRKE